MSAPRVDRRVLLNFLAEYRRTSENEATAIIEGYLAVLAERDAAGPVRRYVAWLCEGCDYCAPAVGERMDGPCTDHSPSLSGAEVVRATDYDRLADAARAVLAAAGMETRSGKPTTSHDALQAMEALLTSRTEWVCACGWRSPDRPPAGLCCSVTHPDDLNYLMVEVPEGAERPS